MAKEIMTIIKLQVPAGGANPSPPVGPALGQHGLNITDFCNAFNEKTKEVEKGLKVPVEITVFEDRTFTFITKSPPASILLKKAASIPKGSGEPNRTKVARISLEKVKEIAEMLELTTTLNNRASGLTADGKQKISLGRGLVRSDVNVIMFDEPLTVIDPLSLIHISEPTRPY